MNSRKYHIVTLNCYIITIIMNIQSLLITYSIVHRLVIKCIHTFLILESRSYAYNHICFYIVKYYLFMSSSFWTWVELIYQYELQNILWMYGTIIACSTDVRDAWLNTSNKYEMLDFWHAFKSTVSWLWIMFYKICHYWSLEGLGDMIKSC